MKTYLFRAILFGVVLATGALIWWSFMPPSLPSSAPSASLSLKSTSETHTQPAAPWHPEENSAPKLAPASSEEDVLPERRCLQLAEHDPRAAVILALDTLPSDTHPGLLETLAMQWAMRDFPAAHEWVLQQRPSEWRDGLMARVAYAGSQSDPAGAARLVVEEMSPGQRQTEAAISVLHQWALRNLDDAATWAASFPEGELRTRAMAEIEGIRKSRQSAVGGL